jgi:hypothetical protein
LFFAALFLGLALLFVQISLTRFKRQAVGLLDDLDKELNNFAMRLREWSRGDI